MTGAFDVCGPLPTGVTVLEASAGTGKTYTIAALAARYVADGVPLDELLLVTFTRMATGELRERVRERLVSTERALATGDTGDDRVAQLLAEGAPGDVERRRDRLARAVAGFDAATITTTHGFCLEALGSLGVTGDTEREPSVVNDADDLLEQVVDDLFVQRWHRHDGAPLFDRAQALQIARAATHNPTAPLEPQGAAAEAAAMRVRFAERVRRELDARKRRARILTYDDLLTRLQATVRPPGGAAAVERLRRRYRIVLVDEFQDTDPVQWDIMRDAFAAPGDGRALVLIGDPKQAIYAFRGADVYAYLAAARRAAGTATLRTNWRSDQPLITALDRLFGNARLGHEAIVYREVRATDEHAARRLTGRRAGAPLRVRVVSRDVVGQTARGWAKTDPARRHVARDVAADIVALLGGGTEIDGRPVVPGDVAVLTRTHKQARLVHDALGEARVPAVLSGAGSVFATDAASEWLRLLEALERPTATARARAVALTCFFGWSARRVAETGDDGWEAVHQRLHAWARVLRTSGVASLVERITAQEALPARVLARADGERHLTDVRHVGELLHRAASAERLGVTALTGWLRERVDEAGEEGDEERTRRLESDADAVQILTIHRSKGLEFGVVYCPYLWDPAWLSDRPEPAVFHDPANDDVRTVDVGLEGREFDDHRAQEEAEELGEELCLAYVALTRARHQVMLWWAGSFDSRRSALSRLAFGRGEDGHVPLVCEPVPTDAEATAAFERLAGGDGCLAVEPSVPEEGMHWAPPAPAGDDLVAARFDRELDRRWRRTSYSGLVAGREEHVAASEPEEARPVDEAADDAFLPATGDRDDGALRDVPSMWQDVPGGRRLGTVVHLVLEDCDFTAPDLPAEVAAALAGRFTGDVLDESGRATLAAGLVAAIETPLGPLAGGLRLRDVALDDRLDELEFELPLAGGDEPAGVVPTAAIADVLEAWLPAGDPLHGYAERVRSGLPPRELRGYLTGFVDVVVRLPDGRFAVVDYKTNRLAPADEPLTAWHHCPAALAAAMQDTHYVLQGLLYSVALHRYLRLRLRGYDPDAHLAGMLYLFLRGMAGAATPAVDGAPCGVFGWRPPAGLVEALSDLLDTGAAA